MPDVAAIIGIVEERFDQESILLDQVLPAAIAHDGLPVIAFETREALRTWLQREHARSSGTWVQLARSGAPLCSISIHDLLEEGLFFGWSESIRHRGGTQTFLQKFAPRRTRGTKSERNKRLFETLQAQRLMTAAGEAAMGTVRR